MTQSQRLVMVAQGIESDAPPLSIQPALADGVHLRWAFKRELGFPWYGYYLFRRPSREAKQTCVTPLLRSFNTGSIGTTSLTLVAGTLDSDQPIVLTDDFPLAGFPEIDLADRARLVLSLPTGTIASSVDASIGFRSSGDSGLECQDLTRLRFAKNTTVGGAGFEIEIDPLSRQIAEAVEITNRSSLGRSAGLPVSSTASVRIADPAEEVVLTIANESGTGVSIVGLDSDGETIAEATDVRDGAKAGSEVVLRGKRPIASVRVSVTSGLLLLQRLCHGPRREGTQAVRVVVSSGGVAIADAVVNGRPGDVVPVRVAADGIERVTFLPAVPGHPVQAAVVDLCYGAHGEDERGGWEPVPGAPEPITLPVFHPDYPATGSSSVNLPGAEAMALSRVLYGNAVDYAGQPFSDMHDALLKLVHGGPGGPTMADASRASAVAGVSSGSPAGSSEPSLAALHPLDLVLLAAINPAAAQMLGLYWADQTAVPGVSYDYLILGDTYGAGQGKVTEVLSQWLSGAFGIDGYIVYGAQAAPAPDLSPPTDARAFSLPLGTVVAPGGPGQPAAAVAGLVGLRWALPLTLGVLMPGSAVVYHLWREWLGDGAAPAASAGLGDWLTKRVPVLVGSVPSGPSANVQWPPDWPAERMYRIDRVDAEGWYGYQVAGMDIFGRVSPAGGPAAWREWAPIPTPRPWYYVDPPGDTVINPDAVRVLDKTPPPSPPGLTASLLDPRDPFVIEDAAYQAWRNSLPAAVRSTLIGVRASWFWRADQMRQAPDTAEFRLYFNPGTNLPVPDAKLPTSWSERVHVTAYGDAVSVSADGSQRFYEVFLPRQGGSVFAAGVPLITTLVDPIKYAHLGVTAADGAVHTDDDPRWAGGAWGNRPGNEGLVGTPAKVFLVRRDRPDPPAVPPDSERVYASAADYHGASYYTYRWVPLPNLRTLVFRALDESVFATDRQSRPRAALADTDLALFPDPVVEPRWNAVKRAQVAAELNGLNAFSGGAADTAAVLAAYRALSNDGLRVLAALPGNERAFSQISIQPLDPGAPGTANRVGPDNPATFPIDPNLRAFVDTLDGRGSNRYFYRAAYVDGAHNRSHLSLSGPPVWLRNVAPPRAPSLTSVTGGDRQISITWASNREPDLASYLMYRADNELDARDVRAMTLVHTEPVAAGTPESRPASLTWTDAPIPGLSNRWYAIVAVDSAGNASAPSQIAAGRAYDESLPIPPALVASWSAPAPPASAQLEWTSSDETRLERRVLDSVMWDGVGDWHPPGTITLTVASDPTLSWRFPAPGSQEHRGRGHWHRRSAEPPVSDR